MSKSHLLSHATPHQKQQQQQQQKTQHCFCYWVLKQGIWSSRRLSKFLTNLRVNVRGEIWTQPFKTVIANFPHCYLYSVLNRLSRKESGMGTLTEINMVRIKQLRRILDNEGEKAWESGDEYLRDRRKLYIEYIWTCVHHWTHTIYVCVCIYIFFSVNMNKIVYHFSQSRATEFHYTIYYMYNITLSFRKK